MSGVFYNENNESTCTNDGGDEVEVAGVYCSEGEWKTANVTDVPEEYVFRDQVFWSFDEGNVVAITVDGEHKSTPYRVKEISKAKAEPKKVILTGPDLKETYIFTYERQRYVVERKVPDKPAKVVGLNPSKENNIHPIEDSWLMKAFGATHQLMAKKI